MQSYLSNYAAATELSNTKSEEPPVEDVVASRAKLYIVVGLLVSVSSLMATTVFFSSRVLRGKYVLFCALSVGDFINGVSVMIAGLFRYIFYKTGQYYITSTGVDCLIATPWVIPQIIAGQFPTLINLSILLERMVALHCVALYRRSTNIKIYLIAASTIFTVVCTSLGAVAAFATNLVHTDRMCTMIGTTGPLFGTIHYGLIAITYLICFLRLLLTYSQLNSRRSPRTDERLRQRMTISLSLISVLLVSIPNFVIVFDQWQFIKASAMVTGITYSLYAVHSGLSFFVYMYFFYDFRWRFFELLGLTAMVPFLLRKNSDNPAIVSKFRSEDIPAVFAKRTSKP
ncbi:hypothetical protein Q1695_007162 [Nippostrongylus brasiliensis]|nr:hypothetical protein Q1695_007162 [Nippostrongylus brasiliensis]